ncbi:hypothetical protein ACMA110817_30600 [Achromobacter marplatensis]
MTGNRLPRAPLERLRGAVTCGFPGIRGGRGAGGTAALALPQPLPLPLTLPCLTVLQTRLALAVETLAVARIRIGRVAAIGRVVLPRHVVVSGVVDPVIDVDVVVPVHVDINVVVSPVEATPHRIHGGHPQAKTDAGYERGRKYRARRRGIVIRRIRRIGPSPVHHRRVVAGHIDHLRVGRLNHHHRLVGVGGRGLHRLLRRALQVAGLLRLRAQPLNRIHHPVRLRQEGVAHGFHPIGLTPHHVHDRRKRHQGFDAGVPAFAFNRLDRRIARLGRMRRRPFGRSGNVVGVCGPH